MWTSIVALRMAPTQGGGFRDLMVIHGLLWASWLLRSAVVGFVDGGVVGVVAVVCASHGSLVWEMGSDNSRTLTLRLDGNRASRYAESGKTEQTKGIGQQPRRGCKLGAVVHRLGILLQ